MRENSGQSYTVDADAYRPGAEVQEDPHNFLGKATPGRHCRPSLVGTSVASSSTEAEAEADDCRPGMVPALSMVVGSPGLGAALVLAVRDGAPGAAVARTGTSWN
ncbi:hypothetical protein ACFQ0G_44975 [Streptomyces chiangmaiensis]|uniref:hypothetical protein n=1 Tax=Streptomyces chiangmaiensis TaxID=766497 RepID=UPI0031F088E7